jgi:hypothetical protein
MTSFILNITFDCADPPALARFWGARVVRDPRPESGWVLMADPEGNEFDLEISVSELDD